MFDELLLVLSFLAGMLGSWIGGTQTFICTGFAGIVVALLAACGVNTDFINTYVLNGLFLPCIIFNGAGFATAYAAKHHNIRGFETGRSLAFCQDMRVILAGGIAGFCGYLIYAVANAIGIPMDTGALSVVTIGVIGRLLLNQEQYINKDSITYLKKRNGSYWLYQILFGVSISLVMAIFAKKTGLYTIGFSISALSLIFALSDPAFPATHHTTLVAGYAIMQTGSISIAVIFGLLAHMVGLIFGYIFNTECGTHIDPPAVAIGIFSLILFAFF